MQVGMPKVRVSNRLPARAWLACLFVFIPFYTMGHLRMEAGIPIWQPDGIQALNTWECPWHCEDLFRRMEDKSSGNMGKVMDVSITERGEPKSGTGFMMGKATEALAHFCHFLQKAYGQRSCRIEMPTNVVRNLMFEPHLGFDDDAAPCSCNSVHRVMISFSAMHKHELPVDRKECPWSHPGGTMDTDDKVCHLSDSTGAPKDRDALWDCVRKTPCHITDRSLQMAILRDPRDVAVSSFYFWMRHSPKKLERFESMDAFFLAFLPTLCKWLSIRVFLFEHLLRDQSSVFMYNNAVANPASWFTQFFSFVGLYIPPAILDETVHAHDEGGLNLGFRVQKLDDHPNGTTSRSYKDEISDEAAKGVDDILRQWLPTTFLDRIDVPH